jgi:hypothetical protein
MDYNNVLYDEILADLTDEKIAVSGKKCSYFVPLIRANPFRVSLEGVGPENRTNTE